MRARPAAMIRLAAPAIVAGLATLALALAPSVGDSPSGAAAAAAHPATRSVIAARARARARAHARAPRAARVRAFGSCRALVRYARRHFAQTHGVPDPALPPVAEPLTGAPGATGVKAPAAATPTQGAAGAGPSYSTTNVQEAGVDEPDIVKTDGATIYTVAGGTLRAVAVDGGAPHLVGSLDLGTRGYGAQLLLRGTRLIVILGDGPVRLGAPVATIAPSPYYYAGTTTVEEVDVSDPAAMRVTRTMSVDGTFVDARQNGATARLVIASAPRAIAVPQLRASRAGWVPQRRFRSNLTGRRYSRPVASCAAIDQPAQFSGLGMLTILTLNLDRGLWTAGSDALMADAQVVYGSPRNLYVATQRWVDPRLGADRLPAGETTVIHRFDASNPDQTTLAASGEVPGFLLNQFSMSEYNGYLRVASTSRPIWWTGGPPTATAPQQPSQSYVTVLDAQSAALAPVGQLGGLGVGQQIYSVRFVEGAGYVVTYRRVDPLYTLDLSTPAAPRAVGRLELEGYSSYLHPLGNGLLLGVGQDVGATNEPAGSQLELFDVADPAAPKLLARASLGSGSSSEVSYDHHAFLFWPPTGLAVLPVQIFAAAPGPGGPPTPAPAPGGPASPAPAGSTGTAPSSQGFNGAIGYAIDRAGGIREVGRVQHDAGAGGFVPAIRRSLVIGANLFTVSDAGVMASALDTLQRRAFAAFPVSPPPQSTGAGGGQASPGAAGTPSAR